MKKSPRITVTARIPGAQAIGLGASDTTVGDIPIGCLIRSRSASGGIIVRLPEIRSENDGITTRFRLVKEVPDAELRIDCAEYHRGDTFVSVVCCPGGGRLSPYWRRTKRKSPFPVDAWFSATDALVTVSYDTGTDRVRIVRRELLSPEKDFTVIVRKTVLFEGGPDRIPDALATFRESADAVFRKATAPVETCPIVSFAKERARR